MEKKELDGTPIRQDGFLGELKGLINKYSVENDSDTPDFILATYVDMCLKTFNNIIRRRDKWYGFNQSEPCDPPDEAPCGGCDKSDKQSCCDPPMLPPSKPEDFGFVRVDIEPPPTPPPPPKPVPTPNRILKEGEEKPGTNVIIEYIKKVMGVEMDAEIEKDKGVK